MVGIGVVLAGAAAFSRAPVRSLFGQETKVEIPSARVQKATLTESTVAIGTVRAKVGAEVKVGSRLSGVVAELNVEVGDKVEKGARLASLDAADWRARVDVLKAQVDSAKAEEEFASGELERIERLRDLVSPLEIDRAAKNVKVARASVTRAEAALAEARISLDYTVIHAPVSGTIGSVSTNRGETIAASFAAPTFVTIIDLDRLEVQSYVDETDIGRVVPGQRVTFRVDAFPGRELEGVVQAIQPKAQLVNNVVNYVVVIDIVPGHGLPIRPEMTVHVTFILEQREGVISVPRSALLRKNGRSFVFVREGERWVEKAVVTGAQTTQSIQIVSGLNEGETVATDKTALTANGEEEK